MADKEITTFVVDISSTTSSTGKNRPFSDLDFGLKYLNDVIASKIIRGRKTDYVSVIAVHSSKTDNPYAGDSFQNIEVVSERISPTYKDLKAISERLVPNPTPNSEYNQDQLGDCFEGVVLAVLLLKDTLKLKYTRNVVLITNGESAITSLSTPIADATFSAFEKLDINLTVIGVDFEQLAVHVSKTKSANIASWTEICNKHGGKLMTASQALLAVLYNPPLKKVRPIKAFKGQLRFGADHQRLNTEKSYEPEADAWCLCADVECYPATKTELLPSGHSYVLNDARNISKVAQQRQYFVEKEQPQDAELGVWNSDKRTDHANVDEAGADPEQNLEVIEDFEKIKGFKYSNYDCIALDEDLEKATKLSTQEGLDIVGFLRKASFPYSYLTEEAYYVLPLVTAVRRSVLAFNSFVQALLDLECYSIVRYVQKYNDVVNMCVLLPTKVQLSPSQFMYTCSMVRIPFREDEKMAKFPFLTPPPAKVKQEGVSDEDTPQSKMKYPTEAANALMESFILAKDLDEDHLPQDKALLSVLKAILAARATNLLPSVPSSLPANADDKLLSYSPAIHKFSYNLRRMIVASLSLDSLNGALDDPSFVAKHLVGNQDEVVVDPSAKSTNLFNLKNVLRLNSSPDTKWLSRLNEKATPISKRLIESLDVKYITKQEAERTKRRRKDTTLKDLFRKNVQGTFGANEGDYDEIPDLDDLLAF